MANPQPWPAARAAWPQHATRLAHPRRASSHAWQHAQRNAAGVTPRTTDELAPLGPTAQPPHRILSPVPWERVGLAHAPPRRHAGARQARVPAATRKQRQPYRGSSSTRRDPCHSSLHMSLCTQPPQTTARSSPVLAPQRVLPPHVPLHTGPPNTTTLTRPDSSARRAARAARRPCAPAARTVNGSRKSRPAARALSTARAAHMHFAHPSGTNRWAQSARSSC